MALGAVKEVVFLQSDPGQSSIGNILYNVLPRTDKQRPPLPIPADRIGLGHFAKLNDAYARFVSEVPTRPFHTSTDGHNDTSPSITSFLCTDDALEIFESGRAQLHTMEIRFPQWKPAGNDEALTNAQVLENARRFLRYAKHLGRRATPHR